MASKRNQWGSLIGFILAASGSAVGLGNIWKFPYIAGENGGGFFVLFYLILILLVGIPLMYSEILIGKVSQSNVVGAFKKLRAGPFTLTGWLGLFTGFLILSFYSVVAGWTLYYLLHEGPSGFSESSSAAKETFTNLLAQPGAQTFYHTVFLGLTMGIIALGVNKGIERVSKILMPLLCGLLVVLMVLSLSGPGGAEALAFMFSFKTDAFTAEGALLALGHVFFSLSLGMGAMITYGSYMKYKENLTKPALAICVIDTGVAIAAGLVLFPIVFGMPADATVKTTFTVKNGVVSKDFRQETTAGKVDDKKAREAMSFFIEGDDDGTIKGINAACLSFAEGANTSGTFVTETTLGRDGKDVRLISIQVSDTFSESKGKTFINHASEAQLTRLPGIDADLAELIYNKREDGVLDLHGLKTLDEKSDALQALDLRALEAVATTGTPWERCVLGKMASIPQAWPRPRGEPGAGPGLVFVTLPAKFHTMPWGTFFGMAFFALLFMAALSSAISILEVVVAYAHERTGVPRTFITIGVGGSIWLVGLLVSLGEAGLTAPNTPLGNNWLDILDNLTSVFLLPLGGLLVALFVAFKLTPGMLKRAFGEEANSPIYPIWRFLIRTVAPAGVAITLFLGIQALLDKHEIATKGAPTGFGTWTAFGVLVIVGLVVLTSEAHNDLLRKKGQLDEGHGPDPYNPKDDDEVDKA